MQTTDRLFAGRFLTSTIGSSSLSSSNPMPSILPSGSRGQSRRTYWRRLREPVSLHVRWHRSFPRRRALWRPTSTSRCSIVRPRRQRGDGRIAWRQADALALPFQDQAFDIVACQFGVMFFPDKVQGYKEARRVLRTDGRFLFNVWDRISENVFAQVVTEALAGLFPLDPPCFMARTPHGHHDVEKIRGELTTAGFISISVEIVDGTSRAASPRDVAIAYCQGTPLRNEIEARDPTRLEDATRAAEEALGAAIRQWTRRRSNSSARLHGASVADIGGNTRCLRYDGYLTS